MTVYSAPQCIENVVDFVAAWVCGNTVNTTGTSTIPVVVFIFLYCTVCLPYTVIANTVAQTGIFVFDVRWPMADTLPFLDLQW
jgi:hypothetical protein